MTKLDKHLIRADENIKVAFEMINNIPKTLTLFVVDADNRMVGTLTDGDIRRGFLDGLQLSDSVDKFMLHPFHYIHDPAPGPAEIRRIKKKGVRLLPVLDDDGRVKRIIDFNHIRSLLPLDAVLMAGGRGERLRPLTDQVPKPMLPVGDKPIIEHNIDHLKKFGIRNYHITTRYLAEKIEDHLGTGEGDGISINYIREEKPMGTIGSVSMIKEFSHEQVLVMNADLFTNLDLEDYYQDFTEQDADMSIATVPYTVDIPYAVMNLKDNMVEGFREKPSYTYHSNAGIYLIRRELLKTIPEEQHFNATDFIQALIASGKKVIRYPIIGYWIDIGKHEDYEKVKEIAKYIHE